MYLHWCTVEPILSSLVNVGKCQCLLSETFIFVFFFLAFVFYSLPKHNELRGWYWDKFENNENITCKWNDDTTSAHLSICFCFSVFILIFIVFNFFSFSMHCSKVEWTFHNIRHKLICKWKCDSEYRIHFANDEQLKTI